MRFPRQEYWSGLPFPSSGDFPDPGMEPTPPASPALQTDSSPLSHQGSPHKIIKRTNSDSHHLHHVHKSHFKSYNFLSKCISLAGTKHVSFERLCTYSGVTFFTMLHVYPEGNTERLLCPLMAWAVAAVCWFNLRVSPFPEVWCPSHTKQQLFELRRVFFIPSFLSPVLLSLHPSFLPPSLPSFSFFPFFFFPANDSYHSLDDLAVVEDFYALSHILSHLTLRAVIVELDG